MTVTPSQTRASQAATYRIGTRCSIWPHRVHQAFADQIVVGWDIAILDVGAYLVEGNKGSAFDIIQRVDRQPVGNSEPGEWLAHPLQALGAT